MSIRHKTLAALVVALTLIIAGLQALLGRVIESGFIAVETRDGERNIARLGEAWAGEIDGLCQKASDWAAWDDAYAFAVDRNAEFVKANLASSAFEGMKLDFILIFDKDGQVLATQGYVPDTKVMAPVPPGLLGRHFGPGSHLVRHGSTEGQTSGLVLTDGLPPALMCSKPILTSEIKGPVRGAIVFGRFVRERERLQIEQSTKLRLTFVPELPAGSTAEAAAAKEAGQPLLVRESDSTLAGYLRLPDVYGERSLIVRARMEREVYLQARNTLRYLAVALILVGLVALAVVWWVVDRLVLRRLIALGGDVGRITSAFDFGARVSAAGGDEISRLGHSINGLLAAGEQVLFAHLQSETMRTAMMKKLPLALALLDVSPGGTGEPPDLIVREASESFRRMLCEGEIVGRSIRELTVLTPDSIVSWRAAAARAQATGAPGGCPLVVAASGVRYQLTVAGLDGGRALALITGEGGKGDGSAAG